MIDRNTKVRTWRKKRRPTYILMQPRGNFSVRIEEKDEEKRDRRLGARAPFSLSTGHLVALTLILMTTCGPYSGNPESDRGMEKERDRCYIPRYMLRKEIASTGGS